MMYFMSSKVMETTKRETLTLRLNIILVGWTLHTMYKLT